MPHPITTDAQTAIHEREHEGLYSCPSCPLCVAAAAAERDYATAVARGRERLGTAFPAGPGDVARARR